jgi:hypothetical protein
MKNEVCSKCKKEVKGARYYDKLLKIWICATCYFKDK